MHPLQISQLNNACSRIRRHFLCIMIGSYCVLVVIYWQNQNCQRLYPYIRNRSQFEICSVEKFSHKSEPKHVTMNTHDTFIPIERIDNIIFLVRGHNVILDKDLANLYGVETRIFQNVHAHTRFISSAQG
jgi:hypothetical protein